MNLKVWFVLLAAVGIFLFSVHLGVFVFLYLPACLILTPVMLLYSRRLKRKKALLVCAKCGKSLFDLSGNITHCPYCGEPLKEETLKALRRKEILDKDRWEYPLTRRELVLRRVLGFLCVFWPIGFAALLACLQDTRVVALLVQLVPILLFGSGFSLFILPCFLTGIYQLLMKKSNRLVNLGLLTLGIVLSATVMFFLLRSQVGSDRDIALMSMIVNASTLTLISGLTCAERMPKKVVALALGTAILATLTIATASFMTIYTAVYRTVNFPPIWNTAGIAQLFYPLTIALATPVAITTFLVSRKRPATNGPKHE